MITPNLNDPHYVIKVCTIEPQYLTDYEKELRRHLLDPQVPNKDLVSYFRTNIKEKGEEYYNMKKEFHRLLITQKLVERKTMDIKWIYWLYPELIAFYDDTSAYDMEGNDDA